MYVLSCLVFLSCFELCANLQTVTETHIQSISDQSVKPVLGMSLGKVTLLGSNLASVTDISRIETPHSLCCDFGGYKTFRTCWSGSTVQVWVQVWAPAIHLAISPKAVPEGNPRFSGKNQRPSSWGSSLALLVLVRLASTNTGCFLVGCNRCWRRPVRLRKTCYHSCNTDSVQESTKF